MRRSIRRAIRVKDPKSIINLIPGAMPELFVSPFAPDALKKKGLTFAWNDTVNGKDMSQLPKDTWLLIDMAAFIADPRVPAPHRNTCCSTPMAARWP